MSTYSYFPAGNSSLTPYGTIVDGTRRKCWDFTNHVFTSKSAITSWMNYLLAATQEVDGNSANLGTFYLDVTLALVADPLAIVEYRATNVYINTRPIGVDDTPGATIRAVDSSGDAEIGT